VPGDPLAIAESRPIVQTVLGFGDRTLSGGAGEGRRGVADRSRVAYAYAYAYAC